ncbi:MAG: organic solvent ABC transporter permease [Bdellovibrionales bacterium RBG_16_40_8]|nr:MAG: organic solvent ABC transporter permease [Bdellovibrionales bacterium RBG_16_40_8]
MRTRDKIDKAIDNFFLSIWQTLIVLFSETGSIAFFCAESIKQIFTKPFRFDEIIKHMEFVGNKSLLIIMLTGAFTGMAMSYQIYLGFELVNAVNLVGPTVALGITRELGPVLTGLIVAARAGGAMAARIGTMRVSEQIDALEVMGIDAKQYLVSPRILAAFVAMPLLCGVFDFVAMTGAYFLCVKVLGLDEAIFWDKIQLWLNPRDINEGLIKSAVFGVLFSTICTYRGYNTKGGAKGVGEATNTGVVYSMVIIIVTNFFMTNIIRFYYKVMGIK